MTKKELINNLHEKYDVSKKDAYDLVTAVFDEIRDSLVNGEKVTIPKFGTFVIRRRNEKDVRNPMTGQVQHVLSANAPSFRPSKTLREAMNADKKED